MDDWHPERRSNSPADMEVLAARLNAENEALGISTRWEVGPDTCHTKWRWTVYPVKGTRGASNAPAQAAPT